MAKITSSGACKVPIASLQVPSQTSEQAVSKKGVLNWGTVDIGPDHSSSWVSSSADVLCILSCSASYLVSTQYMPETPPILTTKNVSKFSKCSLEVRTTFFPCWKPVI